MVSWNWDQEADSEGFVHQSVADTDHDDAAIGKQGYDYANFSEITPDPVSMWPCHEDSGTTVNDVAGTNNGAINGTLVGGTGVLNNTGFDYDGVDDYVDVPDDGTISGISEFTISAWFYVRDTSSRSKLFAKGVDVGGSGDYEWTIDIQTDNTIRFFVTDGGSASVVETTFTISTNTWHFITGVYSDTDDEMSLWIDADQKESLAGVVTMQDDAGPLIFGAENDGATPVEFFDGFISEVRFDNTPLTGTQIQTLYDVVRSPGDWLGTGMVV